MKYKATFITVLVLDVINALTARQAFNQDSDFFMVLSILSLTLAGYFFIKLMKGQVGIIVNATWIALGTMNVTIASYLVFGETITFWQGMGMTFIVLGLILVEVYSPSDEAIKEEIEVKEENIVFENLSHDQTIYSGAIKTHLEKTRKKSVRILKMYP